MHFLIAYCVCVAILISSIVEYLFLCDIAIDILPTRVSYRPSLSLYIYSWYGRGTTDVYHISFILFSIVFYRCCCYCCLLPLFSPLISYFIVVNKNSVSSIIIFLTLFRSFFLMPLSLYSLSFSISSFFSLYLSHLLLRVSMNYYT